MQVTEEQLAEWEALAAHARSHFSIELAEAFVQAIPALIADLREARNDLEKNRCRIHDLETICDPAGLTIENAQARDQIQALQIMYRKAADELVATQSKLTEAEKIEREACAVTAWNHFMDTCKRHGIHPSAIGDFCSASAIRARNAAIAAQEKP